MDPSLAIDGGQIHYGASCPFSVDRILGPFVIFSAIDHTGDQQNRGPVSMGRILLATQISLVQIGVSMSPENSGWLGHFECSGL